MSHYLDISKISIDFPTPEGPFRALDELSLRIKKGEFVSLIGHSGCGKSTVLNILAGLLQATEGGVALDGKEVNEPGPDRAVVFQNHSLLPWLTAFENVQLAVRQVFRDSMSKAEMRDWIQQNLKLVHMEHAMHKRPDELSGGMKQRVGIARALAMRPKVLLTHDVDEAVLLSDRIVMMTNGPAATIGEVLNIDLPRPRNRVTLAENSDYNHFRQQVLSFLYEKQRKVVEIPREPAVDEDEAAPARGKVAGLVDRLGRRA